MRHGESEWNAQGRIQGQGGTGLSELGKRQAKVVAKLLGQRFPQIDLVIGSDLERVAATAQPWLDVSGERMRIDERWREIDVGSWSGLTWAEVQERDPEVYAAWRGGEDVRRGGGETFAEFRVRTAAAIEDLRGSGTVLVFTHGGSVRFAAAAALDLPHMGELMLGPVGNCSITQLELRPGGDILTEYNTSMPTV